ncbi:alpha/beta fold hydrolase [Natronospora cellulosivora (SeqCode)]
MENHIDISGVKIWTEIKGNKNGPVIILCNGGPGSSDYLEPVSSMIEDIACVIRFEQRSCGRSTEDYNCDVERTIEDLEEIRKYYNLSSWIVGGHSWGANLALAYSLKYPVKSNALIYISGNGIQRNREWSKEYHENREKHGELMPKMEGNDKVNKLGNKSWQKYIQRPSILSEISNLTIPSLFLYGSNDVRPSWPAEQISNLLSDSKFIMVEGAAHYIWLSHFEDMKIELRNFIQEIK